MSGTLYGVGLGPGDPELVTLKAHHLITQARVIAYPKAEGAPSFARAIAEAYIAENAMEIPIEMPMRADRVPAREVYDRASAQISEVLRGGSDVVVLCEGDPFLFGSFMYLYERLSAEFQVVVVPGVSSVTACAAALGRPLSARNDTLTVLPATLSDEELEQHLLNSSSLAIMKVGRHLSRIKALLEKNNLVDHAGYVERASLAEQKVMPLTEQAEDNAPYFSMVLVYKGEEAWMLPRQSS
ncbi:precorrin-2 C(20)-methyltransferase [Pseudovibrio sp. SPO723]|uniref:precorrin-2 C(20)-methyltransferase n=1 Tax=Nesiotobacter zosterae TaxID=392721 RepID=UPI0029C5CBEA|nr:precorrin-2 C(20)-methyltransferase [Pseudovibrio sp. SPO723]MDX5592228.1 precorrin-2 C(20)-methyltransferase [Pseudovibrio sp. SPO723]